MIPKIIHYCWFGNNPMPKKFIENIESWKKYLPDYELRCWNENNFDINSVDYVKKAYQMRKWAFVSDYVRLWSIYNYGGIYLDTDVEVLQSFDRFLNHDFFIGMDRDAKDRLPRLLGTGIIGSIPKHSWLKECLEIYDKKILTSKSDTEKIEFTTINQIMTNHACETRGLILDNTFQILTDNIAVYPQDVFCAFNWATRRKYITENTYSLHKFEGSWLERSDRPIVWHVRKKLKKGLRMIVGETVYWFFKDNWSRKIRGIDPL